jgi:hypothetical protein
MKEFKVNYTGQNWEEIKLRTANKYYVSFSGPGNGLESEQPRPGSISETGG